MEAGKLYYIENLNGKDLVNRVDFKVNNKKFVLESDMTKELKFSGKMPQEGRLQLYSNGNVAIAICNKDYCACKSVSEIKVALKDSNCNISDETGEIEKEDSVSLAMLKELETKINSLEKEKVKTGTVVSYMGENVPEGYLACDGKEYSINDYKVLAEHIKIEFGSYQHFGGNGTTTFAVPDLRGEFLRGTGTGSRNSGSGSNIGEHQDATLHSMVHNYYTDSWVGIGGYVGSYSFNSTISSNLDVLRNQDKNYGNSVGVVSVGIDSTECGSFNTSAQFLNKPTVYTSRPTNTSILYCIKY